METLRFLHEKKCPLNVQDKVNAGPPPSQKHTSVCRRLHGSFGDEQKHIHTSHLRSRAGAEPLHRLISCCYSNGSL